MSPKLRLGHRSRPAQPPGPQPRRSPVMIVAGVVLIVAGGLTSFGIYTNLANTQEVVVVVAPVARGERIERTDLATAQIGYDPLLTPVPGNQINQVVGQYATADLVPGTFLAPNAVGERVSPGVSTAEIGVALMAGQYPDDTLLPGDAVLLIALPDKQELLGDVQSFTATLVTITEPNASSMITVSVLVSDTDAPRLAALASASRLALVLTSREH